MRRYHFPEMENNTIYIKNMVCRRCVMAVEEVLADLGLQALSVELGVVTLAAPPTPQQLDELADRLHRLGFELLEGRRERLADRMRSLVIEAVHYGAIGGRERLSDYIAGRMGMDYDYLSALFREETGTTLEKYFIAQRIERAKELLAYGELSLSEIADRLGYSSAAHFGAQFRRVTGTTPGAWRAAAVRERRPLDEV